MHGEGSRAVTKGVDERIDEGILRWLGHVEMMENYMIAKSYYYLGSISQQAALQAAKEKAALKIRHKD